VGSTVDLTFLPGIGNRGDIVAAQKGKVIVETDLTNASEGRLLVQSGGQMEVRGAVQGSLARVAGADSELDLLGSATRDTVLRVSFGSTAAEHLMLGNAERFTGAIDGFGLGDSIDLANIAFDPDHGNYRYDSRREQLVVSDGVKSANISLLTDFAASAFAFASDGHGGTMVTLTPPPDLPSLLAAHA
jgi:hypothetical protein